VRVLRFDRYVIAELIETEKDYVKDLGLIVEVPYSYGSFLYLTRLVC